MSTQNDTTDVAGAPVRRRRRVPRAVPEFDPVDPALPEPVERQVYRSLRRGMMRGLVRPDTVLSGRALAQHLALSVQPVRDALKRLEADGVIEGRPQSGFRLRGMTRDEYWEIIEIRCRLEGLAGRHATAHMTPDIIARLRARNAAMGRGSESKTFLAENFAFHFTIYTEARHATLLALIENLWVRIGPVLHEVREGYSRPQMLAKHDTIIDALECGDAAAVEAAITDDLVSATRRIVDRLS